MKELLKSLPWLRFALMVVISLAFAWWVMYLFNYWYWFPIGILAYMLASVICFGVFGLDAPSRDELEMRRERIRQALRVAHLKGDADEYNDLLWELEQVEDQLATLKGEGK